MYIIQREWHRGYAQYLDSWNIGKNMPSVDEIKLNVKQALGGKELLVTAAIVEKFARSIGNIFLV